MSRLGELLVAAGRLTQQQVDEALRAQVMWGARLGTNLVELKYIDLETLTSQLAKQHDRPAALARHFERADRELQDYFPPELAKLYVCVPLFRTGPQRALVVAASSPLSMKAIAKIAEIYAITPNLIVPAIAAELRIRYQLEHVYGIARPARFMRTPGDDVPVVPQIELFEEDSDVENPVRPAPPPRAETEEDEVEVILLERQKPPPASKPSRERPARPPALIVEDEPHASGPVPTPIGDDDDLTVPVQSSAAVTAPVVAPPQAQPLGGVPLPSLDELSDRFDAIVTPAEALDEDAAKAKRRYVPVVAEKAPPPPAPPAPTETKGTLGKIAIRRVAIAPAAESGTTLPNTLGEAARTIRRATDRDRVADLGLQTLSKFATTCHAATLLVVRGHVATTWKSFSRTGDTPGELSLRVDQPGLVGRATHRNATARASASDLGDIDVALTTALCDGAPTGLDLLVVPIPISGHVVCLLALVAEPDTPSTTAETIAAAVGAAFARLMRNASR
jgi:hypothetical protein